ncbi:saccharopine dehydrogenase NADP-binding domain-containing protein [Saccharopolyspora sp. NFXS83]|uniref:saccharopine dehydrogenase family protein n=1 Tax=Saccharopolyspora sp. NFXS83 TaxID=2993560 RepID=UPI00224A6EDD|nr:saccharopine dehydrogenase NADP-binding domain-containing protein [Saccharopolyspora sp. NFXS83]MCX2730704.1 saccharopine dehydrogenase NADP-binding domain-containing protein [Saccharopolyspora sp. NFXS83]
MDEQTAGRIIGPGRATPKEGVTMSDREFDVVVFGASGFVGRLTALYLAEHAPAGTKIALAGRSESKLARVRGELPAPAAEWPLIIADTNDAATLEEMAGRTRVVCTTVGPYLRYGEGLVAACAEAGTDYVDLTGEVPFVRRCIDEFADRATANGARIVHSCGFDSVPSDLGTYVLHKKIQEDGTGEMTGTTMVVRKLRGGVSGGTIDSMRVIAQQAADPAVRRVLGNPHALSTGPGERARVKRSEEPGDMALVDASKVDPGLGGTLAPFFMASHNTRIVRRSNALLDGAYGSDFHYGETMAVGRTPVVSTAVAGAVSAGTALFLGAMSIKPVRSVLDRILPKAGEGPSEQTRERGHFTTETYTTTTTGARYRSRFRAQGDPGYKATAVMLGESALSLALHRDALPERAGVLTPATAMGDVLVDRLRAAGVDLDVERVG